MPQQRLLASQQAPETNQTLIAPAPHLPTHSSALISSLFRWLGRFSLPTLHRLGAIGGLLTYRFSGRYRLRMRDNMALGLQRPPTSGELREAAMETGRMMFELPYIWQQPLAKVLGHVIEVEGWEKVEALRAEGRAVLALTPHLGCFEIISLYIGERMPMTVLYRPPKQSVIEPILRAGREQGHIKLAPADLGGVRRLIKALRQGEATGLLPDQAPGNGEGQWSPFFGKPAYTMTLAARLSEVQNAAVLLFWGERIIGRGWRIQVLEPHEAITGTLEERVHLINRNIERVIQRRPTQYLWGYNRYKVPAGVAAPDASADIASSAASATPQRPAQ
ncbi:lysophospholipid acyltransferase family protein [Uliginosibacterium sp. H3]|uniref:Lysophospholipid acyltransferase family protein n=1 Tax=Uliginosibacterium silvisoli TaxID=3114758 RepID=A0ABU6JYR6_9RHOO|nr:lysophospholipid acyltransferase family protein [Uliginosibacterium sp. H3]